MAEPTRFTFKHQELAEILVKQQGIHEGVWGIYVRCALGAMNVGSTDADLQPAAIVPVVEIGIQTFEKENNLTVDAAKVNPKPKGAGKKSRTKTKTAS